MSGLDGIGNRDGENVIRSKCTIRFNHRGAKTAIFNCINVESEVCSVETLAPRELKSCGVSLLHRVESPQIQNQMSSLNS